MKNNFLKSVLVSLLLCCYIATVFYDVIKFPSNTVAVQQPYIHSKDCQKKNYLHVDCFDTCNGTQQHLKHFPKHPKSKDLQTILNSLDAHEIPPLPTTNFSLYCSSSVSFCELVFGKQSHFYPNIFSPPEFSLA